MAGPVTGDANTDIGLLATVTGLLGAAVTKWGPQLVRALRETPSAIAPPTSGESGQHEVIHERISGVDRRARDHELSDAKIHTQLETRLGHLEQQVTDHRGETRDGFEKIDEKLDRIIRDGKP